jgi:hypothetical protein
MSEQQKNGQADYDNRAAVAARHRRWPQNVAYREIKEYWTKRLSRVSPPFLLRLINGMAGAKVEAAPAGDFFVRSGPGTVKLPPESAKEYIRTRFSTSVAPAS